MQGFANCLASYTSKRVLITGVTGFKGSWLAFWLHSIGAHVLGFSLRPDTTPALFNELKLSDKIENIFEDILNVQKLDEMVEKFQPEIVFHLAAQSLVRPSYIKPVETYTTNVLGTLNVLEAARKCSSVRAFVNVTTDKCYENVEEYRGYKEEDPMGGFDMYSSSKGCVEIMSSSYRRSFLVDAKPYAMATARAGNVIGGGDWAVDRLIPDCVRSIEAGQKIEIRNPIAVRPWQHVLEPLSGYLVLAQRLLEQGTLFAEGFNFGPDRDSVLTVVDVAKMVIQEYGKGDVVVHKRDDLHEAGLLMLDIEKAKRVLGWTPTYTAKQAISKTIEWYKKFYSGNEIVNFTLSQIDGFVQSSIAK